MKDTTHKTHWRKEPTDRSGWWWRGVIMSPGEIDADGLRYYHSDQLPGMQFDAGEWEGWAWAGPVSSPITPAAE